MHHPQSQHQFQNAQVQPQQQQAGVNPFLNHRQPQMALTVAQPGSQTNQWSMQPPQQHSSVQQPAQNIAMPFVGSQYVAPIPPYTPIPQQMSPIGQGQGLGQNMGQGQMASSQQVATHRPNSSLQAQQTQHQHQPQRQRSQKQQRKPTANDDFFGDFSTLNRRSSTLSTETSRPTTEIQTSGNNENDSVSVLSKSTAENRSRTRRLTPFEDPNFAPAPPRAKGLENVKNIAVHAPPDSDPLPDVDKITHSGYSLARISFRSILIKKWKQVYWITYGTTKILVFRSNTDFEDWVSNPYLTKVQRDFLVKMEVDLVQDANTMNVKGYQVTNLRCKSYQSSMLHQFKLERWMDYGPTIAAAFASQQEQDVYNLRTIISEMMKMHPQQSQHMDNRALAIHHARTYDSVRHDESERGYNEEADAGRHYISGSASAGALSDGASVKSARTVRSYGVVDKVNRLGSSAAGSVRSAAGSVRSVAGSAAGSVRSVAGSAAGSVRNAAGSVRNVVKR